MPKWTVFQLLTIIFLGLFIVGKQVFQQKITEFFSLINLGIQPAIVATFLTIIVTIWGCALLFYWQVQKGNQLFIHKVWRIMPALSGVLLLLSLIGFLILGMTVLSSVTPELHWLIDILIIYFLALFYLLVLSIVVRYGTSDLPANKITTSANIAVIFTLITLFFIPGI
ncbi:hypothetical protein [Sporosarcina koreensis]|uniref:hypothetical protein n=1 Tax=Sporosarcina koreensis TaxID=334735 RepID=UPI00075508D3|nr:hypothetical protein [Sporosarcina koreensis]